MSIGVGEEHKTKRHNGFLGKTVEGTKQSRRSKLNHVGSCGVERTIVKIPGTCEVAQNVWFMRKLEIINPQKLLMWSGKISADPKTTNNLVVKTERLCCQAKWERWHVEDFASYRRIFRELSRHQSIYKSHLEPVKGRKKDRFVFTLLSLLLLTWFWAIWANSFCWFDARRLNSEK